MRFWWDGNNEEAEQVREIYDSAIYGISQDELDSFDITEDDLKYLFDIGFVADNVTPDEREEARDEFFEWVAELGYDISDFDWDAWREFYEETH